MIKVLFSLILPPPSSSPRQLSPMPFNAALSYAFQCFDRDISLSTYSGLGLMAISLPNA